MLKVGLIGCGFMGRMHANVYSTLHGVELVAACDNDPERLVQFATKFGCQPFGDFDQLVASGIDVVDVCLSTYLHKEYTCRAATAGKHVFSEKPMAMNAREDICWS